MTQHDDDGDPMEDWEVEEARVESESREWLGRNYGHPITDTDPKWSGFTLPVWLRIT